MAFILLFSVPILNGSILMKASSTSTPYKLRKRDSSLPYDRWIAFSTNQSKEDVRVKREKEGRWIELTPVSSPLAATKEQMLTLGFKIASLLSCSLLKCSCHPLSKVSEAQIPKHTAVIKHYILVWYASVLAVIVKMKIQNFVNVTAILTHINKKIKLKKKNTLKIKN